MPTRRKYPEGETLTPEYAVWAGIKERCLNPTSQHYKDYGGRGITVCKLWLDSYEQFLKDVGRKPSKNYVIDRIRNEGNYKPGNVRWSTFTQSTRNKRDNRLVSYKERKFVSQI